MSSDHSQAVPQVHPSPFDESHRVPVARFSLKSLLLLMIVVAVCCAAFGLAASIPKVRNELSAIAGMSGGAIESNDRRLQFAFVMVCYAGPLLLAAVLSSCMLIARRLRLMFVGNHSSSEPTSPFDD